MRRSIGHLSPVSVTALVGLASIAAGVVTAVSNGDPAAAVPFALFGLGMVANAYMLVPTRRDGEPEQKQVDIGGVPTSALVFPFVRGRFIAMAAAMTLWALVGLYFVVRGLLGGWQPFLVALGGAWTFLAASLAAAVTVRWLVRKYYVAITPDLLCVRAPTGRMNVPWHDVESVALLPVNHQMFYGITLMPGVDPPPGRWARRLGRGSGAHLYVQTDWLPCHPDVVLPMIESRITGIMPEPGDGVIG